VGRYDATLQMAVGSQYLVIYTEYDEQVLPGARVLATSKYGGLVLTVANPAVLATSKYGGPVPTAVM
jgi:hypothetical protein